MSDIKKCFETRFEDGALVEMDYSQLEIIGLAVLSNDPVLKNDLREGRDIHCQNAADLYGANYLDVLQCYKAHDPEWTKKRTLTKALSFALQYGAGAKSLAKDNGIPLKLAQKFITNYYDRYSTIKTWQEDNIEAVGASAIPSGRKTPKGYPTMKGFLEMRTGRVYEFEEYDAPSFLVEKGIHTSFSPTQIKNYPVQGFSTGDLVPFAIGEIAKYLYYNKIEKDILIINTVHDSILFDCNDVTHASLAARRILFQHLRNLKDIMVSIRDDINSLWPGIDFALPLGVDSEYGKNWGDMKPLIL